MTGVILCGGQSTRMQRDKGTLQTGEVAWAKQAALLLQRMCSRVCLSAGSHQADYVAQFAGYNIIFDDESLPVKGPLKGVFSVHLQYPQSDLLVLACDLANMNEAPLLHLIKTRDEHPEFDAYLFKNNEEEVHPQQDAVAGCYHLQHGDVAESHPPQQDAVAGCYHLQHGDVAEGDHPQQHAEPLCAIYTATALTNVLDYYSFTAPAKHSMKYFLEQIKAYYTEIPSEWKTCFSNFNTPEDLSRI